MGQQMGHSIGDGIIVVAIAALWFGYLYLKYRTRQTRLELIHQERLVAMDKQIPLPELPIDPPDTFNPPDPKIPLTVGVVLLAFASGTMIALSQVLTDENQKYWVMPLPIALMGIGLVLIYCLTSRHDR